MTAVTLERRSVLEDPAAEALDARRVAAIHDVDVALAELGAGWHSTTVVAAAAGRNATKVSGTFLPWLVESGRALWNGRVGNERGWTAARDGRPLHAETPWPVRNRLEAIAAAMEELGEGWHLTSDAAAIARVSVSSCRAYLVALVKDGRVLNNQMAGQFSRWTLAGDGGVPAHPGTEWPPVAPEISRPGPKRAVQYSAEDMTANETRLGVSDERLLAEIAAGARTAQALARHVRVADSLRVEWALDRLVAAGQLRASPEPGPRVRRAEPRLRDPVGGVMRVDPIWTGDSELPVGHVPAHLLTGAVNAPLTGGSGIPVLSGEGVEGAFGGASPGLYVPGSAPAASGRSTSSDLGVGDAGAKAAPIPTKERSHGR